MLEVAAIKRATGLDSFDPMREAEMLRALESAPNGPFDSSEIEEVFRVIFRVSLRLQKRAGPGG